MGYAIHFLPAIKQVFAATTEGLYVDLPTAINGRLALARLGANRFAAMAFDSLVLFQTVRTTDDEHREIMDLSNSAELRWMPSEYVRRELP